jgi:hypothetical protein
MSAIINLTQHAPTNDQIVAGVVDIDADRRTKLVHFLTICGETLTAPSPLREELLDSRASSIFCLLTPELAEGARRVAKKVLEAKSDMDAWNATKEDTITVMVGGAPYLVDRLTKLFRSHGCRCVYALSERVSKEETMPDGSVKKTQVFAHIGFIDA